MIPYPKFVLQRPPFSAYADWIDFNGDDTTGDLLPGTTVNASNRGMGSRNWNGWCAVQPNLGSH